ncbi:MAG: hypothetical protein ABUS51_05725 [Acidobacteriota bacterium]
MKRGRSGNREAGYALLLVYAMAATIAILLYTQLPRVAFEAQRDKEQLLIDRGEQYSRAVQLFVRKFNRFPPDVAALENTSNLRFLRKKYKDPMTGKDEWREVHVGPGGVFTDSLVYGKKKEDQNAPQTFIAEMQQVGGSTSSGAEGVNLATRRRASDQPGAPGDPNNAGANSQQNTGQGYPATGQPFSGNGQPAPINGPVMVLPDGRVVPASVQGAGSVTGQGVYSGQQQAGIPGQPGQATGQNGFPPGVQAPGGIGIQPGGGFNQNQPGFNPANPGQPNQNGLPNGFQNQPNGPPNAAANLINQILTTPRPGGLNGTGNTGTPIGQGLGGQTIGGGFAGVASKYEQEGIKIYKERTAYNEWEFVYDMTKDATRGGGRVPAAQTPPSTTPKQ